MTEQDFIPGADIYLNPERQREAKEKEELVKLRDQFAMAALTGLLAHSGGDSVNPNTSNPFFSYKEPTAERAAQIKVQNIEHNKNTAKYYADRSYQLADAMMEARK